MEIAAIRLRRIALRDCPLSPFSSKALRARFSLLGRAIVAIAFTLADHRARAEQPTVPQVIGEYSIAQPDAVLIVPVSIGTDTYHFMLDTGASRSSVDLAIRPLLGKRLADERVLTPLGPKRAAAYEAPSMALGKVSLRGLERIWCIDRTMNSQIFGERIDGILGMDALQQFIVQIDFDEARLRLLSSASGTEGAAVRLHPSSGVPFVAAHIGSIGQQLVIIDTGSNGPEAGMLTKQSFAKLRDYDELQIVSTRYLSGGVMTSIGRVPTIKLGDHTIKGAMLLQARGSALGLGYLSRFVVTFDFPNDIMYLRPGKQFARVDVPDRSGLHVLRIGNETVVHSVDSGSPSEACGLRAEDRILAIDGIATLQLTMYEVRRRFREAESQLALRVRRGPNEIVKMSFDGKAATADGTRKSGSGKGVGNQ